MNTQTEHPDTKHESPNAAKNKEHIVRRLNASKRTNTADITVFASDRHKTSDKHTCTRPEFRQSAAENKTMNKTMRITQTGANA